MSFIIDKSDLLEIIQNTYPFIPTKSSLQIVFNFKINLTPEFIEVVATDLDHYIVVKKGIKSGEGSHEITVNARKLYDIIKELHSGEVSLDVDENVLNIKSGDSFLCRIAGTDTEDFPQLPDIKENFSTEVDLGLLKEMFRKSSFAVAKDRSKQSLCGLLWKFFNKKTGLIATDGHRLGYSFYEAYDTPFEEDVEGIVSPETMSNVIRIGEAEGISSASVSFSEKYVTFLSENLYICSRLNEGPYPDYEKVIPSVCNKSAVIDRQNLIASVRRVSVLSATKTNLIKLSFRDSELEISVFNKDIGGEAKENLPIEYEGDEQTSGFNAQYLLEILNIIKTDKINIKMNTKISPCIILPYVEKDGDESSGDDLFLIMPLRVIEDDI